MSEKINLLPSELASNTDISKGGRIIKNIVLVLIVLGFIGGVSSIAGMTFLSRKVSQLEQEKLALKTTIESLETTEQSLVLAKDRVQKIQQLLDSRQAERTFEKHKEIIDNLPQTASIKEVEITDAEARVDLLASSSRDVVKIFDRLLTQSTAYSFLGIDGINFNPFQGYLVSLNVY